MLRYNLNCTFLFKLEFYLRLSETLIYEKSNINMQNQTGITTRLR
jgi:hypothetical protein